MKAFASLAFFSSLLLSSAQAANTTLTLEEFLPQAETAASADTAETVIYEVERANEGEGETVPATIGLSAGTRAPFYLNGTLSFKKILVMEAGVGMRNITAAFASGTDDTTVGWFSNLAVRVPLFKGRVEAGLRYDKHRDLTDYADAAKFHQSGYTYVTPYNSLQQQRAENAKYKQVGYDVNFNFYRSKSGDKFYIGISNLRANSFAPDVLRIGGSYRINPKRRR